MKLGQLLKGVDVRCIFADPGAEIKDVVNDSEKANEGTAFAALAGARDDGYGHIKEALSRGCSVIICDRMPYLKCNAVIVNDARQAYSRMCAALFGDPQKRLIMCAVTGTNGKTTVTHMMKHIFTGLYGEKSCAMTGGVQNVICGVSSEAAMTTPDPHELYSLLAMAVKGGARYAFLEASSHALDYRKLDPCGFALGVMTNLTEDHLDHHLTMERYFESKKQLIPLCERFIANGDDEYCKTLECPKFSLKSGEYTAKVKKTGGDGSEFEYKGGGYADVTIQVPGIFNVYNALAALAAAEILGVDAVQAGKELKSFRGAEGRFERAECRNGAEVIIDYAHTPDALEAALTAARLIKKNKLYCVFGCGGDRDVQKRPIMGRIASKYADLTVITSDNSRSEDPEAIIADILKGFDKERRFAVIPDRREAILYALGLAKEGDAVLLAGKGHEKYEIRKDGYHPFSEKKIIEEFNKGSS